MGILRQATGSIRRGAAVVLLASTLQGCATARPIPASTLADGRGRTVVVILRGQSPVKLHGAHVVGDSILGRTREPQGWQRRSVALSDVHRVEVEQSLAGMVLATAAAVGLIALVIGLRNATWAAGSPSDAAS